MNYVSALQTTPKNLHLKSPKIATNSDIIPISWSNVIFRLKNSIGCKFLGLVFIDSENLNPQIKCKGF